MVEEEDQNVLVVKMGHNGVVGNVEESSDMERWWEGERHMGFVVWEADMMRKHWCQCAWVSWLLLAEEELNNETQSTEPVDVRIQSQI